MKTLNLTILLSLSLVFSTFGQTEKIIFDTDIDSDVDDVGALAMLHTLADHGRVDILGIIVTSDDKFAPQCTDGLNHHFGRPQIPIGVEKNVPLKSFSKYTKNIAQEFDHQLTGYEAAEDATYLYRKLLAGQPDLSVTIITVGHLTNLRNLLESSPDENSKLAGRELVQQKVKVWICMGGHFPEGKEANFYRPDPQSTKISVENWPGKVIYAGWEIGNDIITGATFLKKYLPTGDPVRRSYELYNDFKGRQSWDQAAVLYAVSPSYWELSDPGYAVVEEDGSNRWQNDPAGLQHYLKVKVAPSEIAKIIDALMVGIYSSAF